MTRIHSIQQGFQPILGTTGLSDRISLYPVHPNNPFNLVQKVTY
jgi:hypothetical protein